jgi:hypothetical protein
MAVLPSRGRELQGMDSMKNICALASLALLLAGCGSSDQQDPRLTVGVQGGQRRAVSTTPAAPVKVAGYRANFTVANNGLTVTLTSKATGVASTYPAGTALAFFDVQTAFNLDGPEAQLYRLYQASFNRTPDQGGLGYWIDANRHGASLDSISQAFIGSAEFQAMYGSDVSAEQFVMAAYTNVLHRAPEQAGYDWWVNAIRNGSSRSAALLGFADSKENRDTLAPAMAPGFDFAIPRKAGEPIVPQASSYLNKNNVPFETTAMPGPSDPSMVNIWQAQQKDKTLLGFNPRSLSLADFFGDGTVSMFVVAPRFTNAWPNDNPQHWGDSPSYSYFLRKGSDGKWIDDTARLIPNPADRYTCVTPTYSLVADFNNDGKPDLYLPCTGIDFTVGGAWTNDQASEQHLYLSQPDGTLKHLTLPIGKVYGHQATAIDIDGDGNVDVVSVDPVIRKSPFVLWGHGDGSFTEDRTRMPADMQGKQIYGAVALVIDGKLNLFMSGLSPDSWKASDPGADFYKSVAYGTKVLAYSGSRFEYVRDLTPAIPLTADGRKYSSALDVIYHDGRLYTLRPNFDYTAQAITRTDWKTGATDLVWHVDKLEFGNGFDQIAVVGGYLMQFGANCNQYDVTAQYTCAYRIKP